MNHKDSFQTPITQEIDTYFDKELLYRYDIKVFKNEDEFVEDDSFLASRNVVLRLLERVKENKEISCILKYVARKTHLLDPSKNTLFPQKSDEMTFEQSYLGPFQHDEEQHAVRKRKIDFEKLTYIFDLPKETQGEELRKLEVCWNPDFNIRIQDSSRQQELFLNLEQNETSRDWRVKRMLLKTCQSTVLKYAVNPNWKEAQTLAEALFQEDISYESKVNFYKILKSMRYYVPPIKIDSQDNTQPKNKREK